MFQQSQIFFSSPADHSTLITAHGLVSEKKGEKLSVCLSVFSAIQLYKAPMT